MFRASGVEHIRSIMRDDLKERVRHAVDIVEVIGDRLPLKKAGKNYLTRCPFHVEKTASFNVSPERQTYHCFGCGVGGDVFSFVMEYDKVSFPEALRSLAQRAGISVDERTGGTGQTSGRYDALYEINGLARTLFGEQLMDPEVGRDAARYLKGRGLTDETIQKFGLGYAQDSWDALSRYVHAKGFSQEQGVEAGLLAQSEKGRIYDRFRNRVTFPIVNVSGRVVAFGARAMSKDEQAKYLNSAESPVYQKSNVLYGLFHARDAIRHAGAVYIVEGYMDVLQLVQAGIENVVATCGTALTSEHGALLKRFSDRIILLFDGDTAGVRAAVRAGDVLLQADVEAHVSLLPEGDDPDTFVATEGPDALLRLTEQAEPYLKFKWRHLGETYDSSTATGKNKAISDMLDGIAGVSDEIVRNLMAGQVADWSAVDEELIQRALARRRNPGRSRSQAGESERRPERWRPPNPERELLALMLAYPLTCGFVSEMESECFTDDLAREIAEAILNMHGEEGDVDAAALLDMKPDDALWVSAVSSLSMADTSDMDDDTVDRAVIELIASLQLMHVRKKIDAVRVELRSLMSVEERLEALARQQELQRDYDRIRAAVQHQED